LPSLGERVHLEEMMRVEFMLLSEEDNIVRIQPLNHAYLFSKQTTLERVSYLFKGSSRRNGDEERNCLAKRPPYFLHNTGRLNSNTLLLRLKGKPLNLTLASEPMNMDIEGRKYWQLRGDPCL